MRGKAIWSSLIHSRSIQKYTKGFPHILLYLLFLPFIPTVVTKFVVAGRCDSEDRKVIVQEVMTTSNCLNLPKVRRGIWLLLEVYLGGRGSAVAIIIVEDEKTITSH